MVISVPSKELSDRCGLPAAGYRELYLPESNAEEAALIADIQAFPCASLTSVADHLTAAA